MSTYKTLINKNKAMTKKVIDDFLKFLQQKEWIKNDEAKAKKFINAFLKAQTKNNPFIKPVVTSKRKKRHPTNLWALDRDNRLSVLCATKAGGVPYLFEKETWPFCGSCNHPMKLIYQLNLQQISKETGVNFGKGLIQWFQCEQITNSKKSCNDYRGTYSSSELEQSFIKKQQHSASDIYFNKNQFISLRYILPTSNINWDYDLANKYQSYFKKHSVRPSDDGFIFNTFHIIQNEIMSKDYFLSWHDELECGRGYIIALFNHYYSDELGDCDMDEIYDEFIGDGYYSRSLKISKRYKDFNIQPAASTKGFSFAGQIKWVHDDEHPYCPKCTKEMDYLVTANEDDFSDYYLFYCRSHNDELAMKYVNWG
jgi:uncharacterized protein DUF1963